MGKKADDLCERNVPYLDVEIDDLYGAKVARCPEFAHVEGYGLTNNDAFSDLWTALSNSGLAIDGRVLRLKPLKIPSMPGVNYIELSGPGPLAPSDFTYEWKLFRADDWETNPKSNSSLWITEGFARLEYDRHATLKAIYKDSRVGIQDGAFTLTEFNKDHDPADLTSPILINKGQGLFDALRGVRSQALTLEAQETRGLFTKISPMYLEPLKRYIRECVKPGHRRDALAFVKKGDHQSVRALPRHKRGDKQHIHRMADFLGLIEKEFSAFPRDEYEDIVQAVESLARDLQLPPTKKAVREKLGQSKTVFGNRIRSMGLAWLPSSSGS